MSQAPICLNGDEHRPIVARIEAAALPAKRSWPAVDHTQSRSAAPTAATRIGSKAPRSRQFMQVHNAHEVDDDRRTPVTTAPAPRQHPALKPPVAP